VHLDAALAEPLAGLAAAAGTLNENVRGVKPRVRDSGTFANNWRMWSKTPV
jgi:hypothetical protein